MKKYLPLLITVLFSYSLPVAFFVCSAYISQHELAAVFIFGIWMLLSGSLCLGYCIAALREKMDLEELVRASMLVKVMQIPAYVIIFVLFGIGGSMMLVLGGFLLWIFAFLFDCIVISQSGLLLLGCVVRARKEGIISKGDMIVYGVGAFLFVADVFFAILLYKRIRDSKKKGLIQ